MNSHFLEKLPKSQNHKTEKKKKNIGDDTLLQNKSNEKKM
jgi:hypothetical protein